MECNFGLRFVPKYQWKNTSVSNILKTWRRFSKWLWAAFFQHFVLNTTWKWFSSFVVKKVVVILLNVSEVYKYSLIVIRYSWMENKEILLPCFFHFLWVIKVTLLSFDYRWVLFKSTMIALYPSSSCYLCAFYHICQLTEVLLTESDNFLHTFKGLSSNTKFYAN